MTEQSLVDRIIQQFAEKGRGPFPAADVFKLKSVDSKNLGHFHGELDLYLSDIAGYASNANRLGRRPRAELTEARKRLSQSFFERHKALDGYRQAITEKSAPDLFREMALADELRKQLLLVMDEILAVT